MSSYKHIVIGGGISGMTAALLLAREGNKVALIEAFPRLAPTIQGFKRKGIQFETGVHLLGGLGDNHPLDVYFRHLNISNDLIKVPFIKEGYDCIHFEQSGRKICMPWGYEHIRTTLCEKFPEETDAVNQYVDRIRSTFESSPYLNFKRPFSMDAVMHDESCTLKDYLDSLTQNTELKALLSYHTLLYGTSPEEALLSTHALVSGSYFLSCHTVEGGGTAITKALCKQLKDNGVDIYRGRKVVRINSNAEKTFESVTLADGHELRGQSCIWTGHPANMISMVDEKAFRPVYRRRVTELKETPSALILFGIAEKPIKELQGRNIYLWPEGNHPDILEGNVSLKNGAAFISAVQTIEKDNAQAVTAITPFRFDRFQKWADSKMNKRPQDYLDFKKQISQEFAEELFNRCPELKGKIEFIDSATPLTIKDYCSTPYGSLYGAAHTVSQYNPLPVTKIKGLFLAGQSIVAPGLLGAIVSAYLTCGIICGHETIHKELRCIYNG